MHTISSYTILLFLAFCTPQCLFSQLKFSQGSGLANPEYVERSVKNISDEDLFGALRADIPGLREILRTQRHDTVRAYELWGLYWASKRQPKYITQDHQFLLDTEMLKNYEEARSYAAKHPAERDSILVRASLLKHNVIRTWGDAVIDFGSVVDFNREIGQSGKYGFHYWGWSRPLLTAFVLTEDQSYLAKFDELFHRWYEQRNSITRGFPELDVVYYELGLGTRNRSFIEYYFLPYKHRTWRTHERMLKTVLGSARWLYELERGEGYRSGNWQIHGSYMLAQIALVFLEFRESEEWLRMALQRLQEHLTRDFFEDGGHSERAPRNYALATYLSYRNLSFLLTTYKVGGDIATQIRQRMGNTIDWWVSMIAPTGEIPAINDSHRGIFPAFILQDGAEFFRKPYVYGVLSALFGIEPQRTPLVLPSFVSRHMPASGFSIMRSDWSRDALYLNINYGKWNGSHTHSDLLDFEIYAYGKALAVDAGLGLTYDDSLYIPWYRSSRAHNMVTVNGQNLERETSEGKQVVWSSGKMLDYFAAEHDGYARLGVHHRRQIVFAKQHYWLVIDELKCEKEGDTLSWYVHTPAPLQRDDKRYHSITAPGILVIPVVGLERSRMGKAMAASTSNLSPGKTEEISWLAFDQITSAASTKRFVVLLAPYRQSPESVSCATISETHFRVTGTGFTDDLYVSSIPVNDGVTETDARCVFIHREDGQPMRVSLVEGTTLRINGREVWKSDNRVSMEQTIKE